MNPTAAAALADVPFRDTFWNVPSWAQFLLYALSIVAIRVGAEMEGLLWQLHANEKAGQAA